MDTEKIARNIVGLGVIGVFILIIGLLGFRTVDAGEVAVVTRWGAVTGRVLQPGAAVITPFVEGTKYINTKFLIYETMKPEDMKTSNSDYKDGPVDTTTKDGQPVNVYYTITFSIDPTKTTWVVEKFGSEQTLVDKIIRAQTRSVARTTPANFSAEELYVGTGREKVAKDIFETIQAVLAENGIILDSVLIRELGFDKDYTDAISQKQIEFVKVDTEKNKAEQATYRKQAAITDAQAQAEAQRLQRETISPELLQKIYLEKWDGKLPVYMLGNGSTLLNLPALK
ncbi:MAG: hypothetical protein KCHDKBKB_00630 [Elusimicrobia bacterium]|nr:hypothetical protein [Elusimicrobiota bacterium]